MEAIGGTLWSFLPTVCRWWSTILLLFLWGKPTILIAESLRGDCLEKEAEVSWKAEHHKSCCCWNGAQWPPTQKYPGCAGSTRKCRAGTHRCHYLIPVQFPERAKSILEDSQGSNLDMDHPGWSWKVRECNGIQESSMIRDILKIQSSLPCMRLKNTTQWRMKECVE